MHTNHLKSTILVNCLLDVVGIALEISFPYPKKMIDEGTKYLGFFLKPNNYHFND